MGLSFLLPELCSGLDDVTLRYNPFSRSHLVNDGTLVFFQKKKGDILYGSNRVENFVFI
jgi:hypothetical protein